MRIAIVLLSLMLMSATIPAPQGVVFEKDPQALHAGKPAKSPKFISRRAQGLMSIFTVPGERGADLFYSSSSDLGESWTDAQRVNNVAGEVSDHGENSPQFFLSPDEMSIYAFWNARDPKNPAGSHVRFSRAGAMMTTWSPAVNIDDDPQPNSHGFQGAAVGPDGTLYAAWLDMRDKDAAKTKNYTAGAASVYLTRSLDGGKTWLKNVRIASDVCPCCRVSFGFAGDRAMLSWRGVDDGDVRDIYVATSADRGQTWSKPNVVSRDNWKIKGCPHVGASLASAGGKVYAAWFSEAAGKPGIFVSATADGVTFTPKRFVSEGTVDPTHPQLVALDDRVAVTFQARDTKEQGSWGKTHVFYRELLPSGAWSPLTRAGVAKEGTITYPSLALGMSGRTFLGWTENRGEKGPQAILSRGRFASR